MPFLGLLRALGSILGLLEVAMAVVRSGSQIDHYAIEELVTESSTASIYRAINRDTGRQVALKVPHPDVEGDLLFYNRFCREREIGIKLNHPSVVKVIREDHPSTIYIAMEWVEGELLRKISLFQIGP